MRMSLFFLLIVFMLCGCSVPTLTYFRNYTNQAVEVSFGYLEINQNYIPKTVRFRPAILDLGKKTWKLLNDSLPVVMKGDKAAIMVPPGSTVQVPRGLFRDNVVFLKQQTRTDTVYRYQQGMPNEFMYKGGGFPIVSIDYYDFK